MFVDDNTKDYYLIEAFRKHISLSRMERRHRDCVARNDSESLGPVSMHSNIFQTRLVTVTSLTTYTPTV